MVTIVTYFSLGVANHRPGVGEFCAATAATKADDDFSKGGTLTVRIKEPCMSLRGEKSSMVGLLVEGISVSL